MHLSGSYMKKRFRPKEREGTVMNDWNRNGEYDVADSFMDYNMANHNQTTGSSSDWWKWLLFAIAVGVCPPIGIIVFLGVLIFG